MRWGMFLAAVVLGATYFAPVASAADKPGKVLRHIVLYKFRDDLTSAQIQELIDAFCQLPKKIDTVIGFEHGPNVSHEGKNDGLTYAFVVTFKDEAGRDAYIKHPAHAEYVKIAVTRRERAVVLDYWAEP